MTERRTQARIQVSHPVLYHADTYANPQVCSTIDLSTGGARLDRPYGLSAGDGLEISIAIPSRVIRCRARLVYISCLTGEKSIVGIQFQNLSKQDRLYLSRYLSYVLRHPKQMKEELANAH